MLINLDILSADKPVNINFENVGVLAKENHYILKNLQAKRQSIRELIHEKWRDYLPSIGLGFYRQKYIISDAPDSISNEIRLNFEEIIFDGGQRNLNIESAKIDDYIITEEMKIESKKIEFEAKKLFLIFLSNQFKINSSKKNLEKWNEELKNIRLNFKSGFSTEQQILQILSKIRECEFNIRKLKNNLNKAKNDLVIAIGIDPKMEIAIVGDILQDFHLKKPSINLEEFTYSSSLEIPDLKKANALQLKFHKEKEYTENLWMPRLSLGGYIGKMDENFPLRQPTWGLNVKLILPLGNSTSNTNTNIGVRPNSLAGTGIRNDNTNFNNSGQSNIQFFDNLSHSRKILESKLKVTDGITEHKKIENSIFVQTYRINENLKEKWDTINLQSGKFYIQYLNKELIQKRYQLGELKYSDHISAELDFLESKNLLAESIINYGNTFLELEYFNSKYSDKHLLFQYLPNNHNTLYNKIMRIIDQKKKDIFHPENFKQKDYEIEEDKNEIEVPNFSEMGEH